METEAQRSITSGDDFSLTSGKLRVTVLTPWSARYRRTRFMRSAMIPEVWLGDCCFTTVEDTPDGRKDNCGMGLCCEYKCPSSFDENVAPSERWLKPGIGLMTRGEKPWHFEDPIEAPDLETAVSAGESSASFVCQSPEMDGFRYREERRIEVFPRAIRLSVSFINTGERDWHMVEYCHNFLSIGGRTVGRHHHLLLPTVPVKEEKADGYGTVQTLCGFAWEKEPERLYLGRFSEICNASFAWLLYQDDRRESIGERLSEKPSLMQLCCTRSFVSPEAFVSIDLRPGEAKRWSREWFFPL